MFTPTMAEGRRQSLESLDTRLRADSVLLCAGYVHAAAEFQTLAIRRRVSCGVKRRMVESTRTRLGYERELDYHRVKWQYQLTLISLCSRNCRMTFRRYSRFTSSSLRWLTAGELGRGEPGGDITSLLSDARCATGDSAPFPLAGVFPLQYPTPGLRWRSRSAADCWTLRNSSRSVCNQM